MMLTPNTFTESQQMEAQFLELMREWPLMAVAWDRDVTYSSLVRPRFVISGVMKKPLVVFVVMFPYEVTMEDTVPRVRAAWVPDANDLLGGRWRQESRVPPEDEFYQIDALGRQIR